MTPFDVVGLVVGKFTFVGALFVLVWFFFLSLEQFDIIRE